MNTQLSASSSTFFLILLSPPDRVSRLFPLRASNEGHFPFLPTHPCGAETPYVPPGRALGEHLAPLLLPAFRPPSLLSLQTGWVNPQLRALSEHILHILIVRGQRARAFARPVCASSPSLPACHVIPLLLQAAINEAGVRLAGL